jgi:hypothetical protein
MSVTNGIATLADWLGSGGKPVSPDLSAQRADVCAKCPMNRPTKWRELFAEGVAATILAYERLRRKNELITPADKSLGVCNVCGCFLLLKVHTPLITITDHMEESEYDDFPENCWILKERQ